MSDTTPPATRRADVVAAWTTAIGIGFATLMLAWIVGARIAGQLWDRPAGPTVALVLAVLAGTAATLLSGKRMVRRT